MPAEAREGWGVICRGKFIFGPEPGEQAWDGAALWIAERPSGLESWPPTPTSVPRPRASGRKPRTSASTSGRWPGR
eukprot:1740003-Alexandrium_andersonii.AAC.1